MKTKMAIYAKGELSNMIWLWIPLGIYCYIIIFEFVLYMNGIRKGDGFAFLPNELKQHLRLTWFGAITMFIFGLIFNPLLYLYLVLGLAFKGHWPEH